MGQRKADVCDDDPDSDLPLVGVEPLIEIRPSFRVVGEHQRGRHEVDAPKDRADHPEEG